MRLLLIGFGSVGRALARLIEARRESLQRERGLSPRLVAVADSSGAAADPDGLSASALNAAKDTSGSVGATPGVGIGGRGGEGPIDHARLIRDTPADIVIEASPSVVTNPGPAFDHLRTAFASGKHAVTVNKAPLALAMPALVELARASRVQFRYSGTVGASVPVLSTARTLAAGDRITRIRAVINGTTNFILWRMAVLNDTYPAALAEAIHRGYAETDPAADVDGIDTAVKVVILANTLVPSMPYTLQDVRIAGIRDITRERIAAAAARKPAHAIKLVGEIDLEAAARGRPALSVAPQEVPLDSPLNVPECLNAVQFTLESAGETTLIGRGAGGAETATAILRDIVRIWERCQGVRCQGVKG